SFTKGKQKSINETTSKQKDTEELDVEETKVVKTETKASVKNNVDNDLENQPVKTSQTFAKPKPISADKQQYVDMRAYQAATEKPVYKLQLFARSKKLATNAAEFRGIRNTDFFIENGMYKYTIGSDTKYEVVSKLRKEMLSLFPDAFVIAFLGKTKIPINDAIKLTNKNK
ncbi:hypothetical protein JZU68_05640, partial [bacterium]|nr:hypothetical protein [bacterium]